MKRHNFSQYTFSLFICTALMLQLSGCNGEKAKKGETESPQTKVVKEKTDHVKGLEAKINELTAKNKELTNQKTELFEEVKRYEELKEEMSNRIKKLIDGYEPGIWTTEDADLYPVFKTAIKEADTKSILHTLNYEFNQEKLPRLIFKKEENKTVFVGISHPDLLTQQMGSSGAMSYMAMVTYSLTSVKGVDCVFFDFPEGDHAIPGQYCKHAFEPFTLQ